MGYTSNQKAWIGLRLSLGLIFLWAFVDKLFGLGFATCRNAETGAVTYMCQNAWINGGSPTTGFLKFAATGPFASFYNMLAGNAIIDVLFMLGLLTVGITLTLGIAMRLGSYIGALMVFLMWTALLPPENNPLLDDHIVYLFAFLVLAGSKAGEIFSLDKWWAKTSLAKKYRLLR